jgi:outer membrane biosynthesis protein TonB
MARYYVLIGGRQCGPYSAAAIHLLKENGNIHGLDLVWCERVGIWQPLITLSEFKPDTRRNVHAAGTFLVSADAEPVAATLASRRKRTVQQCARWFSVLALCWIAGLYVVTSISDHRKSPATSSRSEHSPATPEIARKIKPAPPEPVPGKIPVPASSPRLAQTPPPIPKELEKPLPANVLSQPPTPILPQFIPLNPTPENVSVRRQSRNLSHEDPQSPFRAYDETWIEIVSRHWQALLGQQDLVRNRSGTVVFDLTLNPYGRITRIQLAQSDMDEILTWLCRRALLDRSPFPPWPREIRPWVQNDCRQIRFTFVY